MNVIRRSAGSGVILLASVVLILCFAGIIGVWSTKSRIDVLGDKVFEAAEDSLAFMDEKLDRIEGAFKNGHRRVGLLSKGVNRLPQKEAEAKEEATSLLKALDEEVFGPLKSAQMWLDSTHAVAVVEILTTLKEVRQGLIDIRDDVLSARRIVLMIVARLAQVEKRMANLCGRIERFHARVVEMKGEIAAVRDTSQWWTMLGAVLATLLLAWFAASQIGMVLHGWSLAKRQPQ
jgi:hypothetical protein